MPTFNYPQDFDGTGWLILDGDVYVSSTGSDDTGNGSPAQPYASLQHAINSTSAAKKIVVGTGNYNENVDGQGKGNKIVADGTVLMEGTGGDAFFNMGSGTTSWIEGFNISGYANAINNRMSMALRCVFKNSNFEDFRGTLQNCIVENSTIRATANTFIYNCTLINVQTEGTVAKTKFKEILDTHIGTGSLINVKSASLTLFDYCNQEPGSIVNIDNTNYSTSVQVHAAFSAYQTHGINVLPQFNKPDIGDYSLKISSSLLNASSTKLQMGAIGFANAQSSVTLNNVSLINVTIDANGKYVLVHGYKVGTIETAEIDLGSKRSLGKINLFAEEHFERPPYNAVVDKSNADVQPNKISFELRYTDFPGGTRGREYKEFTWDKTPTIDAQELGNGSENFDESTAHFINTRYVQFRITLREDTNFLLQEDGYYILQEDNSAIVLE
ncbi:MAG TPA: hypothetical protein VFF27_00550 [Bacteroidia bacterium]|jgi:hypothetical protein|nr:hypothetical protein [Bacteroidia bacterium]